MPKSVTVCFVNCDKEVLKDGRQITRYLQNEKIKNDVRKTLKKYNNKIDVILSHTCPFKYMPYEVFLENVNQLDVDKSTEKFLDEIENNTQYQKWYCGHYHTDKQVDKIRFMMNDIEELKL